MSLEFLAKLSNADGIASNEQEVRDVMLEELNHIVIMWIVMVWEVLSLRKKVRLMDQKSCCVHIWMKLDSSLEVLHLRDKHFNECWWCKTTCSNDAESKNHNTSWQKNSWYYSK